MVTLAKEKSGALAQQVGVAMNIPAPLPIDELLICNCEKLIKKMNRSERKRIHRALLSVSREANDKLTSDNSNIAATRLSHADFERLINICDASHTDISAFLRKVITREIKRKTNENSPKSL